MRNGHLLFSAVEFLIVAALFLAGAAFFCLHFLPHMRGTFSEWILHGSESFLLIGCLVTAIAFLLGIGFAKMQKGSYIRMRAEGFSIRESLLRTAIVEFWKEELPERPLPEEIYCANNRIEVIASEMEDLKEIEGQLGAFLAHQFGYEREYFLTVKKR